METIPTTKCKAGVEHKVTYLLAKILWIGPDSIEEPGRLVPSKAFIDCTEKPLPSPPFGVGAKVIVYCEARMNFDCLAPIELTSNGARVQAWLDEVEAAEGSPALLQIHQRLLEYAALVRRTAPRMPVYPTAPFLFVGKVVSLEGAPCISAKPCMSPVVPRRSMELAVSRILWGDFTRSVVHASCNSWRCGDATAGETVFMSCGRISSSLDCSSPAPYSDDALPKVENWLAEAGLK